jgi:hypothetical protein
MAMDQIVELFLMDIPKLLEEKSFAIEIVDFFSWRLQNSESFAMEIAEHFCYGF